METYLISLQLFIKNVTTQNWKTMALYLLFQFEFYKQEEKI